MCPVCGSGKVAKTPEGRDNGLIECQDCDWRGGEAQLVSVPLPADELSLDISDDRALAIARHMSEQYMRLIYSDASQVIGSCILRAGLVGKRDTKGLTRLLRAACTGAHKATLEEAEKISSEYKSSRVLS